MIIVVLFRTESFVSFEITCDIGRVQKTVYLLIHQKRQRREWGMM